MEKEDCRSKRYAYLKEYQRVYRQWKKDAEPESTEKTSEEKDAHLPIQREAWREGAGEAKCKHNAFRESIGNRKKLQKAARKKKLA